MIKGIQPTSKASLKLQCLFATKGDIDEATKLYDFFAKDIPALPDFDPVQPNWVDSTKNTLTGIMQWANENPNAVNGIYNFFRSLTGNRLPELPVADGAAAVPPSEPLPPINE